MDDGEKPLVSGRKKGWMKILKKSGGNLGN